MPAAEGMLFGECEVEANRLMTTLGRNLSEHEVQLVVHKVGLKLGLAV